MNVKSRRVDIEEPRCLEIYNVHRQWRKRKVGF